jgi:hypothetical protein
MTQPLHFKGYVEGYECIMEMQFFICGVIGACFAVYQHLTTKREF